MKTFNLQTGNTYLLDSNKLNILKKEAKNIYSKFLLEQKKPLNKRAIVMPGVYNSDFSFHYKFNGLKNIKSFMLIINKTKETFNID